MKAKKIRKCTVVLLPIAMMAAMPASAQTRQYYVAAEDGTWDFAPSRRIWSTVILMPRPATFLSLGPTAIAFP